MVVSVNIDFDMSKGNGTHLIKDKSCVKLVVSATLWQQFRGNLKSFRMEIENAGTEPSKTNQLWNIDTVGWKSRDITAQPGEIYNRKSKLIEFVVNACMNISSTNLKFKSKKGFSLSHAFALLSCSFAGYIYTVSQEPQCTRFSRVFTCSPIV